MGHLWSKIACNSRQKEEISNHLLDQGFTRMPYHFAGHLCAGAHPQKIFHKLFFTKKFSQIFLFGFFVVPHLEKRCFAEECQSSVIEIVSIRQYGLKKNSYLCCVWGGWWGWLCKDGECRWEGRCNNHFKWCLYIESLTKWKRRPKTDNWHVR